MHLRAYDSKVVVEEDKTHSQISTGGIALPEDCEMEDHLRGKVISVGEGHLMDSGERCPLNINVGDVVLFHKAGGFTAKVGDKEVKVIQATAIIAFVEE